MLGKILILVIFLLSSPAFLSQTRTTSLLKIKLDDPILSITDTVGYKSFLFWHTNYYYNSISYKSDTYLFFYERLPWGGYYRDIWQLNNLNNQETLILADAVLVDDLLSAPYLFFNPFSEKADNGKWIIHGQFGNFFISDEGSLHQIDSAGNFPLCAVIGKINDKYLLAVSSNPDVFSYYLTEINDVNNILLTEEKLVHFENGAIPQKMKHIQNDFYLIEDWNLRKLSIFRFSGNEFLFVKHILDYNDDFTSFAARWSVRESNLYFINDRMFSMLSFNNTDTTFINERILFEEADESKFSVDEEFQLSAFLEESYLKLFSIMENKIVDSLSIAGLSNPSRPLVDPPFIYLHQYITTTGIEDEEVQPESYKLSVFPNPFNSSTVINYSLPSDADVDISVYDLLGNKIAEIDNGYKKKGIYKINFNASSAAGGLSSGTYFIRLGNDIFSKIAKVILLK